MGISKLQGVEHPFTNITKKLFGQIHQIVVIDVGGVKLQHGELRIVLRGHALVAKTPIDLVNTFEAPDHQSFEVQFRGDSQVEFHVQGVVVGLERLCGRAAGDGMHHRRLHFQVIPVIQKVTNRLNDPGSVNKGLFHLRVDDEVNIALPVTQFDILETMPFFGKWLQGLGEQGQGIRKQGELSRSRFGDFPPDPDNIADVKLTKGFVMILAQ